jgi:hypothetical protein
LTKRNPTNVENLRPNNVKKKTVPTTATIFDSRMIPEKNPAKKKLKRCGMSCSPKNEPMRVSFFMR